MSARISAGGIPARARLAAWTRWTDGWRLHACSAHPACLVLRRWRLAASVCVATAGLSRAQRNRELRAGSHGTAARVTWRARATSRGAPCRCRCRDPGRARLSCPRGAAAQQRVRRNVSLTPTSWSTRRCAAGRQRGRRPRARAGLHVRRPRRGPDASVRPHASAAAVLRGETGTGAL